MSDDEDRLIVALLHGRVLEKSERLRAHEALSRQLRDLESSGRPPSKRVLFTLRHALGDPSRVKFKPQKLENTRSLKIATYLCGYKLKHNCGLEAAVSAAMERFDLTRSRVMSIWSEHKPSFERMLPGMIDLVAYSFSSEEERATRSKGRPRKKRRKRDKATGRLVQSAR